MAEFLGNGLGFPLELLPGGGFKKSSGSAKVEESIRIILGTAPGERLMRQDFGCGIHDLVFEPNTAMLRGAVRERVEDALRRFEPRIDVLGVEVDADPERDNELHIGISYRLRSNNAMYNLVYPFYLREGGV